VSLSVVAFVGKPDEVTPIGLKGVGEIGVSAAIANAIYHATGGRIRSLPITIDQLLLLQEGPCCHRRTFRGMRCRADMRHGGPRAQKGQ
jgi:hypothetical protein